MNRRRPQHRSLLNDYCHQLGALLERRSTERVLVAAKEQAEAAAAMAQAADRAKSQFLATMSHELRTPLNAIIGFSEIIQGAPAAGDVSTYAKYIHESGSQLLGMLNGVLDLARIEAGRIGLDEQEVMLEEVLEAAIRLSRKAAEEKSVTIMCGMLVDRLLRVDLSKMTQVFANLLANAVKFTPVSGNVDIDSDLTPEGGVVIWIRDNGPGIPPADLARVLQPFGQLEDHLTRQNGGVGLGLPTARALVRLHGGELMLDSKPEIGTTVEIRLPAERVRSIAAAAA